ncbi:TlpA disulfide reductase family protein [Massilibacteroides sp.]|uniref:TlpA family protein disulfide reductase n=1 Tax=Massilibacteroides sp. TaxID=2034766 RepID=UPI00261CD29D|nr:TlpA disulfide reductase family protein [Massilibacteroides sp.]MDD4516071.1 TlpA disulfide reductase family protein [Massilibacteroides sp.]
MKKLVVFALVILCIGSISCKKSTKPSEATTTENSENKSAESTSESVADDRGYIVSVGDQAPNFIIEYLDGTKTQLSQLKGKLVMLQFTASWCGVCRKEMPFIEKDIWSKHKNNPNFALIGIDLKEDKETTAKFADLMKVTYPLTLDTDGSRFTLFTAPKAGVTRNIIIDKDGKIVLLTRLFETEEFNSMVKFIDNYLETNF